MSLGVLQGRAQTRHAGAGKLNTDKANLERIRVIADRLVPHVATFRQDAVAWQWEVNLETRDELNAYCAPGGKIMFFTGIIKKLRADGR
jgi:Zn-dependent protease with chaperone function